MAELNSTTTPNDAASESDGERYEDRVGPTLYPINDALVELEQITGAFLEILDKGRDGPEPLYRAFVMRMCALHEVVADGLLVESISADELSMRVLGRPAQRL